MTADEDTAIIARQLAELTRHVRAIEAQLARVGERADSQEAQAEIQRERSGGMEWKNENQFVFTSNDVKLPVTFTRVQN